VIEAIQIAVPVARIEFLDEKQIDAVNKYSKTDYTVAPTLFFEFHSVHTANAAEQSALVEELARAHGARGFQWAQSREERDLLWQARHAAYYASLALRPGAETFTTDVCVPISRLAECINETKLDNDAAPFPTTMVGHVGDGNFHVCYVIDPACSAETSEAERLADRVVKRAIALGGTSTGEHGVGLGKKKYMEAEHGAALNIMRAIKNALDPDNRMNPGKIFN
jgi:D-lactate dehydrogenase (cytochrome)